MAVESKTISDMAEHADLLIKVIGGLLVVCLGLVGAAWGFMLYLVKDTKRKLEEHCADSEDWRTAIYGRINPMNDELNRLLGEHKARHKGE